jgi:hypothetical protein
VPVKPGLGNDDPERSFRWHNAVEFSPEGPVPRAGLARRTGGVIGRWW